jgi:hypothetical protein
VILALRGLLLNAADSVRAHDVGPARERVRDYDDVAPQRAAAGPQHLRCGRAGDDGRLLSQVAVAVGQAEGGAALLIAAAGAAAGAVLGVLAAVP